MSENNPLYVTTSLVSLHILPPNVNDSGIRGWVRILSVSQKKFTTGILIVSDHARRTMILRLTIQVGKNGTKNR